ncbi:hypothetical protein [Streptomyces sp. NPDC042319]|uniref:hypothetical protein n=1 Tax=Streptomyces sp. NPDC042319 TaxID=3154332 RepID=UPI0033D03F11
MKALTEYETLLRDALTEVTEHPRVQVFSAAPGEVTNEFGDAQQAFSLISILHGVTLDPALQRCFIRFNKLSCHWRFEQDAVKLTGEFNIRHLVSSLGARPPEQDWGETEFDRQLYSELRVIEDYPGGGSGTFAALRLQPANPNPEVWYHDFRQGAFRLDIDYCGYLTALALTKGISGWQYLFADVSLADEKFAIYANKMSHMLDVFPDLFPEHDYQPLRDRLEARL